jgi:predicted nucleotidyltransferase
VACREELTEIKTPPNVLLSGIVGSVAYGLDTEDSDVDRLGVFAAPTEALVGLRPPNPSVVSSKPDVTYHEAGKFATLLLKTNPTVTELLYLPDDLYEVRTPLGDDLIAIRSAFLSRTYVRNAYLGYASSQFRRLEDRGDGSFSADTRKRTAKHARHLLRLLVQGLELYETGVLTVRLERPGDYRAFGERVAAGNLEVAQREIAATEHWFDTAETPLPEQPDEATVEAWLQDVRRAHYCTGVQI